MVNVARMSAYARVYAFLSMLTIYSCFGLNMLSTLPLECFVCREVMFNYWFPNEPFNMNLHMIFTTALVVSAMAMALITCDLGVVFELVGATSACALAYILPPLCYIKLSKRSWRTYVAVICAVFGMVVMMISLTEVSDGEMFVNTALTNFRQAIGKMITGKGGTSTC